MTLGDAFSANAATFYDARSGKRHSLVARYLLIAIATGLSVWLELTLSKEALSALITVFWVLLGFGYSVQFYIAGTIIPADSPEDSIEKSGDKRVLRKLSNEIYDNVSYLNYVIFLALLPPFSLLIPTPKFILDHAPVLGLYLNKAGMILLWFFSIEAAATFYRVLMRSSLYFGEKKRLQG